MTDNTLFISTIDRITGQLSSPTASGGYACNSNGTISSIAVAPSQKFLFVLDKCVERVHVYSIAGPGIRLVEIPGSPFYQYIGITPGGPASVAIDSSGKYLYEALPQVIVKWNIDSTTGALTPTSVVTQPPTTSLVQVTLDPSAKFLFAADGDGRIFAYLIGSDGTLSPVSGSPFAVSANGGPGHIVIEGSGKFLYALLNEGGVAAFTIDSSTGELASVSGSPFPTTYSVSEDIVADPSGRFLYVAVAGSINGFNVDASSGRLSSMMGSPFSMFGVTSLAVAPSGQFLYTLSSNGTIIGFSIDPSTGSLTAMAASPFPAAPAAVNLMSLAIP